MDISKYFNVYLLILIVVGTIGGMEVAITAANLTGAVATIFGIITLVVGFMVIKAILKSSGK